MTPVHGGGFEGEYRRMERRGPEDRVTLMALPDCTIDLEDIFG